MAEGLVAFSLLQTSMKGVRDGNRRVRAGVRSKYNLCFCAQFAHLSISIRETRKCVGNGELFTRRKPLISVVEVE